MSELKNRFLALMEEHQGIVHYVSALYSNSAEERKDLSQEIIFQLWKSFRSFQHQSKFSTWLYRVALNTAISYIRTRKKVAMTSLVEAAHISNDDDNDLEEDIRNLYQSIGKLSKIDRAVILLYMEDYSYQEMADILGISSVNVGVRINRIKKKLKDIMTN